MCNLYVTGQVARNVCKQNDLILFVRSYDRLEYWEFPGGNVKSFETPEEAAVREMEEETALVPASMCLIKFIRKPIPHDPNIVWEHFVYEALGCEYTQIQIDTNEIVTYKWMTRVEALMANLESLTKAILESNIEL